MSESALDTGGSPERGDTAGSLLGRDAECAAVEALLTRLRAGCSGALVVSGEPGIGKTSLLAWVLDRAEDVTVLRATCTVRAGVEPYGLLAELAGQTDRAERARGDLPAELGCLRSGPRADEEHTSDALIGWFSLLAEQGPLLVVVDDVQWADVSSLQVLCSAIPVLGHDPIAFLFGRRSGDDDPLDRLALPELELAGLAETTVEELLADVVAPPVARQLARHTGGNPLALLELAASLDGDERSGRTPIGRRLAGRSLSIDSSFLARVEALSADARRLLEIVSVDGEIEVARLLLIGRALGTDVRELDGLVARDLVRITGTVAKAAFAHPLLRAAVYRSLEPSDLRSLHRRIAETLRREGDLPRRAWHRAAAAEGADEEAATDLEGAGVLAAQLGAHGVAADALERSARLTPSGDRRAARLMSAGRAAWLSGDIGRGRLLLDTACTLAEDPLLRADVRLTQAFVPPFPRSFAETRADLVAEAEAVMDADRARGALLLAAAVFEALVAADPDGALSTADRALALAADDDLVRGRVEVMRAIALALRGDQAEAMVAFRTYAHRLRDTGPSPDSSRVAESVALGLCAGEDFDTARMMLDEIIEYERDQGTVGMLGSSLVVRSIVSLRTGRWLEAFADADLGTRHARRIAQHAPLLILGLLALCRVEASLGRHDEAREHGDEALDLVGDAGGLLAFQCSAIVGFCALAAGDTERALELLLAARRDASRYGIHNPAIVPWHADLVEAATEAGEHQLARAVASELADDAARIGGALWPAIASRCRGIVAGGTGRVWFEQAVWAHREPQPSFELARTELAYAAKLTEAGDPEAFTHVDAALRGFQQLGATPWSERAARLRSGSGSLPASAAHELSARELQVALAAADGKTNRLIAHELFLSPRTVEFHLAAAYRKLGVHNRVQLANVLKGRRTGPGRTAVRPSPAGRRRPTGGAPCPD